MHAHKKNKWWLLILVFLIACTGIISVIIYTGTGNTSVIKYNQAPSEYRNLVKEYLELREVNSSKAYDLCYFKPEYAFVKQALINSGMKVLKTDIKELKKINDNLYSFLVEYELEDTRERGYSFVANINGELYIIVNKRDIPDNLKKNYIESEYDLEMSDSNLYLNL